MGGMKNYEELKQLKPEQFKRLTGVTVATFELMLQEYTLYHKKKKSKGGKPNKLSVSTQVLLMLAYYKEYRSMAHMAFDYQVSEWAVSRTIKEVERVLLGSNRFSLPSKRVLCKDDGMDIEYIIVDTIECPTQRPKKNRDDVIVERRDNIP